MSWHLEDFEDVRLKALLQDREGDILRNAWRTLDRACHSSKRACWKSTQIGHCKFSHSVTIMIKSKQESVSSALLGELISEGENGIIVLIVLCSYQRPKDSILNSVSQLVLNWEALGFYLKDLHELKKNNNKIVATTLTFLYTKSKLCHVVGWGKQKTKHRSPCSCVEHRTKTTLWALTVIKT